MVNEVGLSPHRGHGVADQGLMNRRGGLNIWCDDNSVLPKVKLEGIAGPASLGLHDVEGNSPKEVLESRADSDAVSLQGLEAGCASGCSNSLQEFGFGEGAARVLDLVGEKVRVFRGLVDS